MDSIPFHMHSRNYVHVDEKRNYIPKYTGASGKREQEATEERSVVGCVTVENTDKGKGGGDNLHLFSLLSFSLLRYGKYKYEKGFYDETLEAP